MKAGIFFTDGSKVLLLQKPNKKWGLPGGKPHENETPKETAERETREEIGTLRGSCAGQMKENEDYMIYFYVVGRPFSCSLSTEHIAWKWIPFDELSHYMLHPKLEVAVARCLKFVQNKLEFKKWAEAGA